MDLFKLGPSGELQVTAKLEPQRFAALGPSGARERDLEDLIVARPELLAWGRVQLNAPDLLIVARQPVQTNRRRADLLAVNQKGNLVTIEVKRDAEDEARRGEALEFQALRYAAAASTIGPRQLVDYLAKHMEAHADTSKGAPTWGWREEAVKTLARHLSDADDEAAEEDIERMLEEGMAEQRVYLVASGFDPDVLSACIWLRRQGVDMACFRFQPFHAGSSYVLQRERVVPPPAEDDFLQGMVEARRAGVRGVRRRRSDSPTRIEIADQRYGVSEVSTWKQVLVSIVNYALDMGVNGLPAPLKVGLPQEQLRSAVALQDGRFITTSFSAADTRRHASTVLKAAACEPGEVVVVTESGMEWPLPLAE